MTFCETTVEIDSYVVFGHTEPDRRTETPMDRQTDMTVEIVMYIFTLGIGFDLQIHTLPIEMIFFLTRVDSCSFR